MIRGILDAGFRGHDTKERDIAMPYVPHTERETREMLAAIGVDRMEDLFADVPAAVRFPALALPPPSSEMEIMGEMQALAARNAGIDPSHSFLGAGAYHH